MKCYNCGTPLDSKANKNNVEHIPPRCLFEGFPISYRDQRITVPACRTCNNKFSRLDEEFRNYLGVTTKNPKNKTLVESTTRSMVKSKDGKSKAHRIIIDKVSGKTIVKFRPRDLTAFHIKNFKGLFFHHYGFPIPDDYTLSANYFKELIDNKPVNAVISYLTKNFSWRFSGHEEIFKYILQPLRSGYKFDGADILPEKNERFFAVVIYYNESHAVLVTANNKTGS